MAIEVLFDPFGFVACKVGLCILFFIVLCFIGTMLLIDIICIYVLIYMLCIRCFYGFLFHSFALSAFWFTRHGHFSPLLVCPASGCLGFFQASVRFLIPMAVSGPSTRWGRYVPFFVGMGGRRHFRDLFLGCAILRYCTCAAPRPCSVTSFICTSAQH